ncbi:MAG: hypothetical protein LUD27_01850 [Clostridia bacterium]|nr:hypothetical protein [Clostridia bacterium]
MSKDFWINGEVVDREAYINDLRLKIKKKQTQVAECENLVTFVNEAIEEHFKTVFKPLNKAIKEFDSLEAMHEMYGYGAVSEARYKKVCDMADEQEKLRNTISQFDLLYQIKQRMYDLNFEINSLQSSLNYAIRFGEDEENG